MTRPVAFTAAAQAELIEGAAWYDAKRPGLGDDFVAQIDHCVRRISEQPTRYPVVHKDIRRILAARFPYSVYFFVEDRRVVVLAVFHGRRDPAILQRRGG